jgi:signal transduction histidine kinase/DNA-binding response OmpR family regulator
VAGDAVLDFLGGGGEMGARMRAHDWSTTLGPPERWPPSLKTAVRVMLTSRQPTWIGWGPELIYLYNDAYRDVVGGKHPWALGRPTAEVWSEIMDDIGQSLDTALRGDEGVYIEGQLLIMERNGYPEETYYTYSYSPVPGADGRPGGIICFNTDDTRRVIGDRQLATLREQAAATVTARDWRDACERSAATLAANRRDLPFAAIYVAEPDGAFALAAAGGIAPGHAAAPVRIEAGDERAWPLADILADRSCRVVDDLAARFGDGLPRGAWSVPPAQAVLLPIPATGERGRAAVLVAALSPHRLYDASYAGFLELAAGQIGAAIAQADAFEEERRRAEELARLDQAKTLFFSNVSHEFRTPLTLMLGPLEEWLARADGVPAESRALVELAHSNGERLLKLVNTLLDFARIEAGRAQARFEPTDLCPLTRELASSFRSAIEKAGLALHVNCATDLPPVYVDREMWEKIVLNLLSNAFKFTLEGRIAVTLARESGHVVLKVSDTGIGIPAAELPQLFERFHRIEGTRGRSIEGSGIGLALVRELVSLHGGELGVESTEGRGTTFTVRLPLGKAHLDAARVAETGAAPEPARHARPFVEEAMRWLPADVVPIPYVPAPGTMGGRRILLADDNRDMRHYVQRLLQGAGWRVECVADGEAALAAIRRERPALLLADVMMPRLDGLTLVKALRADPALALLPVILLSARAGEEARVEGLSAGADDYLVKPFTARELLVRVQSHVALSAMRREAAERERALREKAERAEHTLRHRTVQFETLLHAAPIGVYLVDANLRILEVNPVARAFFGEPEPLGQHLADAMRRVREPDVAEAALRHFRETLATGAPHGAGGRFERRPGSDAPEAHAWEIHRIGLPDGSHGVVCYFRDVGTELEAQRDILQSREALRELNATLEERVANEIAERAKAEEQLRQAQKMEAIGHLTGGVAHDFNNLLTVIIGNLELVQRYAAQGSPERLGRFADNAMLGARRAATLTQRLLAFARRQPLEPRPVDANRLVLGMFDLLARTLGESISVDTVLANDLWKVEADANQLENALLNLVVNARDAMPQGGRLRIETANVHVAPETAREADVAPGAYARITVIDSGAGMPPEVRDRVFEPFFTTKPTGHGTGLGLSQVYGFVRQSGGFVTLESEPGHGTTVRIHLPRLASESAIAEAAPSATPEMSGRETILVVEDNPDVRDYTTLLLRELGHEVLAAEDAPAALLLLARHPQITLLLTDIGLPGMNGRELAEHALAQRPDLKVLFVSGYARQAIVHHGRLDPGVQMLAKPFTYAELAEKLAEVMERGARMEAAKGLTES